MKRFGYSLWANITECFSRVNILFHLAAIGLTYLIVTSGFDWLYFKATRNATLQSFAISAAGIGFLVPIILPLSIYLIGKIRKNSKYIWAGIAVAQAELIAYLISIFYKALTGRIQPEFFQSTNLLDISHQFNFGFLQHGIFWGWPSSHTAVAFGMSMALLKIYPENKILKYLAIIYAFFIGLGVSVTIHWFSDFVAGAILGSLAGMIVGKNFLKNKY